jgi:hypothetical protein
MRTNASSRSLGLPHGPGNKSPWTIAAAVSDRLAPRSEPWFRDGQSTEALGESAGVSAGVGGHEPRRCAHRRQESRVCRQAALCSGPVRARRDGPSAPHHRRVGRLTRGRWSSNGGSVSKWLTVDCHFGAVGVKGQHPSYIAGLSRRRLVAPHDAVVGLSVDVERPI